MKLSWGFAKYQKPKTFDRVDFCLLILAYGR